VLYIVRFEWKRLSSHRNLQNGIARGLKSPVGDEGVPGIDFINTERAHAVDPCILNADEYSMVVKHRPTIQRIIDEVEALVSNDPSATAAKFPGFSKVAAKSYMSAALKTYYRATIPSDLLRVCVDCNVGDNDDDNSPEAIQKAITRAFVKFHKAQGKQERTPSGVGKWGQKPPKPLTEGVWLAQQKVLGHVREQGGEAKASQDLKTVFILRLPHNDAHDEVPIEIIVRRNPLTLAQHQIYKKKRLQTYMASTPHPASMWFVWKLWLQSLWTAVWSCRGGSMSSDWRLVGTYKEALSQRDDPADGGSADNAEPAQRGQKNSSFVRDIRQKRKKNEAPGKGHGRYNLAQAIPIEELESTRAAPQAANGDRCRPAASRGKVWASD